MRGERERGTMGEDEKRVSQVIRKEERNIAEKTTVRSLSALHVGC